jgi:hypothetical protein
MEIQDIIRKLNQGNKNSSHDNTKPENEKEMINILERKMNLQSRKLKKLNKNYEETSKFQNGLLNEKENQICYLKDRLKFMECQIN